MRKNELYSVLIPNQPVEPLITAVPPQFLMVIGAAAVPRTFLNTRFLYATPAFRQMTAPGFKPNAWASIRYAVAGTVYVQPQSPVVAVFVVPSAVVLEIVSVEVSSMSSSEHWKNKPTRIKVNAFVTDESVFPLNIISCD